MLVSVDASFRVSVVASKVALYKVDCESSFLARASVSTSGHVFAVEFHLVYTKFKV